MVKRTAIPKESVGRMIKAQGADLVADSARVAASAYAEQRIAEITVFALDELKLNPKNERKLLMKEDVIFAIKKSCVGIGDQWRASSIKPSDAVLTVGAVRGVMKKAGANLVAEDAVTTMINYVEFELKEIVADAVQITQHANKKKVTAETLMLAKNMKLAKKK